MIKFIKMTYELSLKLNNLIDKQIIKYAMFDNDYTDEYSFYESKEAISNDVINNYMYVIYDDFKIVGTVALNIFKDEIGDIGCNINPIIVFKDYRKQGYASMIIEELKKKEVIKENINYFECVVDESNFDSVMTFRKNGFEEISKNKNFIHFKFILD